MTQLAGRSFLKEFDFTPEEWTSLLDLAAELKPQRRDGTERQRLVGRTIALIFEKASSRTRSSFEVAAAHQGAHTTYFDPTGSHIRGKESIVDTALLFGRLFDGIEWERLAAAANGSTIKLEADDATRRTLRENMARTTFEGDLAAWGQTP